MKKENKLKDKDWFRKRLEKKKKKNLININKEIIINIMINLMKKRKKWNCS